MLEFFERGFMATMGAVSLTREKTQEMVDDLVKRGEISKDEGKQLVDRMVRKGQEEQETFRKMVRQEVQVMLKELDLPDKQEIESLKEKIDTLTRKLDEAARKS
jgi:polyhydroxyalkanoate synthesis regulator phasin